MPARVTGQPVQEAPMAPANPLANYSGGGLQVGGVGVPFNPQSFVGSDAYKFLEGQGRETIERRAGANGTLLTGGTLKDLTQFGQGNAASFWGQQLGHDTDMARINAGISEGNANRTMSGLSTLAGYGMNAAGGMSNAYGNYGQAGAQGTYGQASAINQGMNGVASTLGNYFAQRKNPTGYQPGGGIG